MPRNTTINRRNIGGELVRKTLFVSEEAIEHINAIAAHLMVTQGSLTDSALRYFASLDEETILQLLSKYGHLTSEEERFIRNELEKEAGATTSPSATATSASSKGSV